MSTAETTVPPEIRELSVGKRIRWARKVAGLSQERLAELLGTTRQVVIKWEKGRHLPNERSREKLARATGQEPGLFTDIQAPPDNSPEAVLRRQADEMIAPFPDRDDRRSRGGDRAGESRADGAAA